MKKLKLIFLTLIIVSSISNSALSQIIKGEALMGFNLSHVEGDEVAGFKMFGFNIGA